MKLIKVLATVVFSWCCCANAISAENTEVEESSEIDSFAALPFIRSVSVAADGSKIAVVRSTSKNGDYIIEIYNARDLSKKPVVLGASKMLVSGVIWVNNNKIAVAFRQLLEDGAHKFWVSKYAFTDADGRGDWLVPFSNSRGGNFQIIDLLPQDPSNILIYGDANNNRIPDVIKLDVNTGRNSIVVRGSDKINGGFMTDSDGDVRIGQGFDLADSSIDIYARVKGSDEWKLLKKNLPTDRETFDVQGVDVKNPNLLYINMNHGEDKAGIYTYDLLTGKYSERQFGLQNVDVDGARFNRKHQLVAFSYTNKYPENYFLSDYEQGIHDALTKLFPDEVVRVVSRSDDDNILVLFTQSATNPGEYYLLVDKKSLQKVGPTHPLLKKEELAEVKYISYSARDGRKIYAYVTVPKTGKAPYPTVVLPHGGPWVRDVVVFDEWSQLLAHHGYLVIQPNYRGSTGYGLEYWKAGDKNWGLKMQDDLDDAAQFLISKGLADKTKLAMFGWSYGGYAAFVSSMRDNNIYKCSIAGAGVSDLNRLNAVLNDNRFLSMLQQPTVKGVSPVEKVDKVNIPILVIHGDIDSRVPVKHSHDFVDKLKEYHKDYRYVELKDADHFYDTLFYEHKETLYRELLGWLDNKCGFAQ